MKLLLLFAVVAVGWWLIRTRARAPVDKRPAADATADPAAPEAIVACRFCGVHLPAGEALAGRGGGVFCDAAHRAAHEASQAGSP